MTEDEPKRVHTAPRRRPRPATVRVPSLVLINTGNGKGKTTAALGTALRAIAQGWPVGLIQFMKSGRWKVGEERIARSLGVDWWTIGAGFTWEVKDIDQARATAEEAWRVAAERIDSDHYRLIVLDEITYPINYGWIQVDEVIQAITSRPSHPHSYWSERTLRVDRNCRHRHRDEQPQARL